MAIASELAEWLVGMASSSPGVELCGLLFGRADRIDSATSCRNVHADPARRFEIDPAALLAAHRAARAGGPPMIGCWHTHPSGTAVPSRRDAEDAAADGSLWLMATERAVRAWRARAGGAVEGRFDPVTLIVDPG